MVAPSNDGPACPKKLTLSSIKLNTELNDKHLILPLWDKIEPKELLYKKLVIGKFTRDKYHVSTAFLSFIFISYSIFTTFQGSQLATAREEFLGQCCERPKMTLLKTNICLAVGFCCCCAVQWHDHGFASEVFGLCQSNPQRSCALLLDLCPEIMWFTCSIVSSDHMLCSVCLCPLFTVLCLRVSHCSLMYI